MNNETTYSMVQDYLKTLVPPRSSEMQAMEIHAKEASFPIIGAPAGYLCYQIARIAGAKHVFELGSGYGYSTAWFAKAVTENGGGTVHHVVWDSQLSRRARGHLGRLGYGDIVEYHVGEAVETLNGTPGPFDLIFNDINKESYPVSLPVIEEKLKSGGVLIVDNMLWLGRIFDENDQDPSTQGVREFTRRITSNDGWIASIVPIRDGLLVAYKV